MVSWLMLLVAAVWWSVLPRVSTHSSEGPGLLVWMFSLFAISFAISDAVKFVIKIKTRK